LFEVVLGAQFDLDSEIVACIFRVKELGCGIMGLKLSINHDCYLITEFFSFLNALSYEKGRDLGLILEEVVETLSRDWIESI
jgi:hypothetical protein